MRGIRPSGEMVTKEKRRRLRDIDILRDRDLHFLIKVYQGCSKTDIAREYKISRQFLNRRLMRIDERIKSAVQRLVAQYAPGGDGFVPDAALDSVRRIAQRVEDARNLD